jgi:ABC-type hemin transport system substrate-binding protein
MTAPELQQEIERTRQQLSRTVDELAAKADVKARAKEKVAEAREKALERAMEMRDKARERAVKLSGQVQGSQVVQRGWPLVAAAGVLAIGSTAAAAWQWRAEASRRSATRHPRNRRRA